MRGQVVGEKVAVLTRLEVGRDYGPKFFVTAEGYRDYQVEFSTNLIDWTSFTNVHTTNYHFDILDSGATNSPQRFYRVKSP